MKKLKAVGNGGGATPSIRKSLRQVREAVAVAREPVLLAVHVIVAGRVQEIVTTDFVGDDREQRLALIGPQLITRRKVYEGRIVTLKQAFGNKRFRGNAEC